MDALLKELFTETVRSLLERIKAGEATAADLSVARAMLKDNAISSTPQGSVELPSLARFVKEHQRILSEEEMEPEE